MTKRRGDPCGMDARCLMRTIAHRANRSVKKWVLRSLAGDAVVWIAARTCRLAGMKMVRVGATDACHAGRPLAGWQGGALRDCPARVGGVVCDCNASCR